MTPVIGEWKMTKFSAHLPSESTISTMLAELGIPPTTELVATIRSQTTSQLGSVFSAPPFELILMVVGPGPTFRLSIHVKGARSRFIIPISPRMTMAPTHSRTCCHHPESDHISVGVANRLEREEECAECYGTGYWRGFGAPCSKRCKS